MNHKEFILEYQNTNNLNQKIQCFDLSKNNDESKVLIDASCKDSIFDGVQIYLEDGVYEVAEMVYNSHINVFCETKSFKVALKYFFRGNKQKIKKVIQSNKKLQEYEKRNTFQYVKKIRICPKNHGQKRWFLLSTF